MRHYIYFASPEEYFRVGYSDTANMPAVRFQTEYLYNPSKLLRLAHLAHYFSSVGKKFNLPFRRAWFSLYFREKCISGDEYVFVFFFRWNRIVHDGYTKYLRKHYPGCKCVLFLQDVNNAKKLNIDHEKKLYDHIMIFEKNFADENGIEYYPLVYSEGLTDVHYSERPIDLLFVGGAKGRYQLLKTIYDRLTAEGINCQFYLSRFDGNVIPQDSGIHIVSNVDYYDNIRLLKQSKCVLDIVPKGTNCNTLRMSEAIVYENRVLTNNENITEEPYYDPSLISIYSNPQDIDCDFLKKSYSNVDYNFKDNISSAAFLRHLDEVLYNK